jgi:hypothetical protein
MIPICRLGSLASSVVVRVAKRPPATDFPLVFDASPSAGLCPHYDQVSTVECWALPALRSTGSIKQSPALAEC